MEVLRPEINQGSHMALGAHYLAEFYHCDREKINDLAFLEKVMIEATNLSGANILKHFFHQFNPQGISGIIVIAESHFAIHTWPEHGYAAVDLFSCAEFNYKAALNHIRINIGAGYHSVSLARRGVISTAGEPQPCEWSNIDIL
jgi:S-adenosylmethionine decarboxylase